MNSLRVGTDDYDFDAIQNIKKFGQGYIFEIKSKIDGKTYIGKRLEFQIRNEFIDPIKQTQAEREITLLKL